MSGLPSAIQRVILSAAKDLKLRSFAPAVLRMTGVLFLCFFVLNAGCRKWDVLSEEEKTAHKKIMNHWESWVPERKKDGSAPLMTFDELLQGLGTEEKAFLNQVRAIDPKKSFGFQGDYLGSSVEGVSIKKIENQQYRKGSETKTIEPQYLPENVYEAYARMMQAMKKDLGKGLLVESGYRSPAFQLYLFLFYLPGHGYSLVETGRWVALPGYSEHGAPHSQAIDFMNEEGENGEGNVDAFEELPEYDWLNQHAYKFGFELSYPRGKKGITFEPWHWRYCGEKCVL